ncbi:MAG TPA: hypothetical protein VJ960_00325 [Oceanipulchritudo sp.]|nr:hypothetical protein [Oceanipulchritudo sp.]
MSTATDQLPEICNFPPPEQLLRKNGNRPGLSIDAIIQRTRHSGTQSGKLIDFGEKERLASLEEAEIEFHEKESHLAQTRAELAERERVVNETELLLAARERLLNDREALLQNVSVDGDTLLLQKNLRDAKEALELANRNLAGKDQTIASLRARIEDLKARNEEQAESAGPARPESLEQVSHPSLAEQVAFLRERETFIEASENTLFDKAQSLQEWETRLQQSEHDQSAFSSQREG